MAEFVGIDPAGVRRLITSMDDAVQRVRTLRPSLSASIAEAGTDCPPDRVPRCSTVSGAFSTRRGEI